MKKIIVLLVLFVYSAATIGATVHLHYCMDKFVGWSLLDKEKGAKCVKCGMTEKKGGCCKDEKTQLKLEKNYQKSSAAKYVPLVAAPALLTSFDTYNYKVPTAVYHNPFSHAPPHIPKRLHLLNCVFLI